MYIRNISKMSTNVQVKIHLKQLLNKTPKYGPNGLLRKPRFPGGPTHF